MDPEFEDARESFCRDNCALFEDTDENKLEYTEVRVAWNLIRTCIGVCLFSPPPTHIFEDISLSSLTHFFLLTLITLRCLKDTRRLSRVPFSGD